MGDDLIKVAAEGLAEGRGNGLFGAHPDEILRRGVPEHGGKGLVDEHVMLVLRHEEACGEIFRQRHVIRVAQRFFRPAFGPLKRHDRSGYAAFLAQERNRAPEGGRGAGTDRQRFPRSGDKPRQHGLAL